MSAISALFGKKDEIKYALEGVQCYCVSAVFSVMTKCAEAELISLILSADSNLSQPWNDRHAIDVIHAGCKEIEVVEREVSRENPNFFRVKLSPNSTLLLKAQVPAYRRYLQSLATELKKQSSEISIEVKLLSAEPLGWF